MIKHFDLEESDLIGFAAKTYSHGVIPLEPAAGYPQLFYYFAGIFLSPYTFLKGLDFQVITVSIRSFNLLISIISALAIYFFVLRFFKSLITAILSSVIFSTSPFILFFSVNSRPHALSTLFFIAAFYYCFLAVEKYKPYYMRLAVIFSAFSTATNFFGVFSIPAISLSYLNHIHKIKTLDLATYLKSRRILIYLISSFMAMVAIMIPSVSVFAFFKFPGFFHLLGINDLQQFLNYRNFKILSLISIPLFLFSIFIFRINRLSANCLKNINGQERYRWFYLFNAVILNAFFILCNSALVFLILNPAYLFFPGKNIKSNLLQASVTTMGSGLNGHHRAIFDLSGFFVWTKMLFDNQLLNKWFALLFIVYILYEIINLKKNWLASSRFVLQRCLLWSSCLFLFLTLAVCVSHRPHHYLPPINIVIGILSSFAVVEIIRMTKNRYFKFILIAITIFIYCLAFNMRRGAFEKLIYLKNYKMSDTGLVIGRWLEQNYDKKIIIWKDAEDFYIPPKFTNVSFTTVHDDIAENFQQINKISPDILIITSQSDPWLANVRKVDYAIENGILKGYKKIRKFRYEGPLASESIFGLYREVHIYDRKSK